MKIIKPAMSHTISDSMEMTLKGQRFVVLKEGKTCEPYIDEEEVNDVFRSR